MNPKSDDIDKFVGMFIVDELGQWEYEIEAWIDRLETWRNELRRRNESHQTDLTAELAIGNLRFNTDYRTLEEALSSTAEDRYQLVRSRTYTVDVDPKLAKFSAWYEMFPRSFGGFQRIRENLDQFQPLGFNILYFPPIHPIGTTNRKGKNNSLTADRNDPGSPWAIGNAQGGHTAIDENLGTLEDFSRLIADARNRNIEIAMDIAFQCSPDHPWLKEHPEWFAWKPDGTVQFAENPPKRYEDIVNFNFDSKEWWSLWNALKSIVEYWIAVGVKVFRVDNPHTKPISFWQWLIKAIRLTHPDVFFLAEAFTRPALMYELARIGFGQSYTYFTWRNSQYEISKYVQELVGEHREYFRPNFFTNTPDILSRYLQTGGKPAFASRAVLAATMSPAYGVYSGYENYENIPIACGSEEYLNSEKYEVKNRQLDGPLLGLLRQLNEIRNSSAVFERLDNILFLNTANEQLIGFVKQGLPSDGCRDVIFVCVNLDPHHAQEGLLTIPLTGEIPQEFMVDDLLSGSRYHWQRGANYVHLEPGGAHILKVQP